MASTPPPSHAPKVRPDGTLRFTGSKGTTPNKLRRSTRPDDLPSHDALVSRLTPPVADPHADAAAERSALLGTTPQPVPRKGLLGTDDEFTSYALAATAPAARGKLLPRLRVPTHLLNKRESVQYVEASMAQRLEALQAEIADGELSRIEIVQQSQGILNDSVHELTRQVGAHCEERGLLLARVWLRYADLVNAVCELYEDERQRHTAAEQQSAKQLQQARIDYATVVSHSERLVQQHHEKHVALLQAKADREDELTKQLSAANDELRRLQAAVRHAGRQRRAVVGDDLPIDAALERSLRSGAPLEEELGKQLTAARKENEALAAKVRAQELLLVDATSEVARLRDFLQSSGPTPGAQADAPAMRNVEVLTDVSVPPDALVSFREAAIPDSMEQTAPPPGASRSPSPPADESDAPPRTLSPDAEPPNV